jgi:Uma2 family endonuclease
MNAPAPITAERWRLRASDFDTGRKAQLYADAGIAEYWVVDVNAEQVIIHHQPSPDGYRHRAAQPFDASLQAFSMPSLDLGVVRLID